MGNLRKNAMSLPVPRFLVTMDYHGVRIKDYDWNRKARSLHQLPPITEPTKEERDADEASGRTPYFEQLRAAELWYTSNPQKVPQMCHVNGVNAYAPFDCASD